MIYGLHPSYSCPSPFTKGEGFFVVKKGCSFEQPFWLLFDIIVQYYFIRIELHYLTVLLLSIAPPRILPIISPMF